MCPKPGALSCVLQRTVQSTETTTTQGLSVAPLCPLNQLGTQVFCKVGGGGPSRLLISAVPAPAAVCDRMPSSVFAAIFGCLPGAPLKGSRESCQKPARPPLTGGAPGAAQEAPCPGALSPSLLRPPRTSCFPSGRLPSPDWRAGRMLDGIPSEAEAFFRATWASSPWRLDEIPETAREKSGQLYL